MGQGGPESSMAVQVVYQRCQPGGYLKRPAMGLTGGASKGLGGNGKGENWEA